VGQTEEIFGHHHQQQAGHQFWQQIYDLSKRYASPLLLQCDDGSNPKWI